MDQTLDVVRGRQILEISGREFRQAALAAERVVVDLGAGDGRWILRLARSRPNWCCLGIDANAAGMRETSWRASRKPQRGGAPNAWFVRAAVEALPDALDSIADEIYVQYPWGSLRRMLLHPEPDELAHLARIGRRGAAFRFTLNLPSGDLLGATELVVARDGHRADVYALAGLVIETVDDLHASPQTSWGKRLRDGRAAAAVVIAGRVAGLNRS